MGLRPYPGIAFLKPTMSKMALLQMKNQTLKILAKVKVTFFARYTFLRNRLSDRAETKCKLFLAKFEDV